MAKVIVLNNIFDTRDTNVIDVEKAQSVRDILYEGKYDIPDYSSQVEVYDPDTGETSYLSLEDDKEQGLNVCIKVNGLTKDLDYVVQPADAVVVEILPAANAGRTFENSLGNIFTVVGAIMMGAAALYITSLTGGAAIPFLAKAGLVIGGLLVAAGTLLIWDSLRDAHEETATKKTLTEEQRKTLEGASNQNLVDMPFPVVVGKIAVTPYTVGTQYNELVYTGNGDNQYEELFGSRMRTTQLLAIGYAPLLLKDIKFDELVAAHNHNNVLVGELSYLNNDPEITGHVDSTFNGKPQVADIESKWRGNKVRLEISQFGSDRKIYPFTVKQQKVDAPLLYCYDEDYKEVANEKYISWQGGSFPCGMRTNTIRFSDGVPYKIVVGIDIPNGLWGANSIKDSSATRYSKIPMNLVVQWRPVYKYITDNNLDSEGYAGDVYDRNVDGYGVLRYSGWRNFTGTSNLDGMWAGPVPQVTYTGPGITYRVYKVDNTPAYRDGFYGYFVNSTGTTLTGTFHKVQKRLNETALFREKLLVLIKQWEREHTTRETFINAITPTKGYVTIVNENGTRSILSYQSYWKSYIYPEIKEAVPDSVRLNLEEQARQYARNKVASQDADWCASHENTTSVTTWHKMSATEIANAVNNGWMSSSSHEETRKVWNGPSGAYSYGGGYWGNKKVTVTTYTSLNGRVKIQNGVPYILDGQYANTIAQTEVSANKGLSPHTSGDSNPTWYGVRCFSLGKFSLGKSFYQHNSKADPDFSSALSIGGDDVEHAKDEMRFEISTELTQEDILDLINRNPMSIRAGEDGEVPELLGKTSCTIDSIQVRVVRLTPCYLEKQGKNSEKEFDPSYKYADVVKWSYIKTYCVDKQKILDSIDEKSQDAIVDGQPVKIAPIDCSLETFDSTDENIHSYPTWNTWNIMSMRSVPVAKDDEEKLCLLGIEAEPDQLGVMSDSLNKVSLTAAAVTPALRDSYIRYWYTDGTDYWKYDSYDTLETKNSEELYLQFAANDLRWKRTTQEEFEDAHKAALTKDGVALEGYWYSEMHNAWDKKWFPAKIEKRQCIQYITDANGEIVYNDGGEPLIEMTRDGNDWIPYIYKEMARNTDTLGRWIASNAFINTFTDRNSIGQLLGVACGQSLGRNSYFYNSLNDDKFIRFWYEDDENGKYYYYDTDDTEVDLEHKPVWSDDGDEYDLPQWTYDGWAEGSEIEFRSATLVEIGGGYYYSIRKADNAFNMMALKEAFEYTEAIDIGKSTVGAIPYKCNMYITAQQKALAIMQTILVTARAFWFYDEYGRFEIHNDKPKMNPVLMITDENSIQSSNMRDFSKGIAGYHLTFNDEANGFQQGEVYVLREGQTRNAHTRDIIDQTINGVTNAEQVWSLGAYMLACSITQKESWTRKLNHVGGNLTIGSLVSVQSSTLMIGTDTSGRIAKLIEDENFIYGFICDLTYDYREEYGQEGENVQGCSIFQAGAKNHSKVVTLRFANAAQQQQGIAVDTEDPEYAGNNGVYANLKGQTNLVLFEKKIIKQVEREFEQGPDEATDTKVFTQFIPKPGDIVAFGNVGSITKLGVVYQLTYDEKHHVTASIYPYYDSIYHAGRSLPVLESSMTKLPYNDTPPVDFSASMSDVSDALEEANKNIRVVVQEIVDGDTQSDAKPDTPVMLGVYAFEKEITGKARADGAGLRNSVVSVDWQMFKWTSDVVETDDDQWDWVDAGTTPTLNLTYLFDRETDGYPEADDLNGEESVWFFRCRITNQYGNDSEWSRKMAVQTAGTYGTWALNAPAVNASVTSRYVTLKLSQPPRADGKELYGNTRYRVEVMRPDVDSTYYKPATGLNPYASESNYKDGSGYVISDGTYVQVMPLKGQDTELIENTLYMFRITAENEAGISESTVINTVTECDSIRDIVKAKETAKEAYISQLSAISANMGCISGGSFNGSQTNYWELSSFVDDNNVNHHEGAFRVGGDKEYMWVIPVDEFGNDITSSTPASVRPASYRIEFQVGSFHVNSTATEMNGDFIIQENQDSIDRIKVTPRGVYLEHRANAESPWVLIAGQNTNGVQSQQLYSEASLIVSNQDIDQRRQEKTDIGTPYISENSQVYHFDTDVADQNKVDDLSIVPSDSYSLVDEQYGKDYKPAILAVSPFSTVAKSIMGLVSITKEFTAGTFTVDFWCKFLTNENFTLFDLSTPAESVVIKTKKGECFLYEKAETEECPMFAEQDMPTYAMWEPVPVVKCPMYHTADGEECQMMKKDDTVSRMYRATDTQFFQSVDYAQKIDGEYTKVVPTPLTYDSFAEEGLYVETCNYNTPDGECTTLEYEGSSFERRVISWSDEGKDEGLLPHKFNSGDWIHCAVVFSEGRVKVFLGVTDGTVASVSFIRNSETALLTSLVLNSQKKSMLFDELLVDTTTAESLEVFTCNTVQRRPWGALPYSDERNYFILEAENTDLIKTNIGKSSELRADLSDFMLPVGAVFRSTVDETPHFTGSWVLLYTETLGGKTIYNYERIS